MKLVPQKIHAELEGLAGIIFDRFYDHSSEVIPPERKIYLNEENQVIIPNTFFKSFLCREMPPGAIKQIEKRAAADYIRIAISHLNFGRLGYVNLLDGEGNPIVFTKFADDPRWEMHLEATVTLKGSLKIKQPPLPRPKFKGDWKVRLEMTLFKSDFNNLITPEKLHSYFEVGGMLIGIGNHRPDFGRFQVVRWDVREEAV